MEMEEKSYGISEADKFLAFDSSLWTKSSDISEVIKLVGLRRSVEMRLQDIIHW